ncbi:MAG: radical SAM protein [Defluviitaleaceae bacterium]|nr:radical SAM protein [Defluviitaleaceae bacterium]
MTKAFEIGPIRPPSEAASLLLRVTRNCSWNKCKFCNLYRGQNFSTRPIEDIKADIDQAAQIIHNLSSWAPHGGNVDSRLLNEKLHGEPLEIVQRYLHVMHWLSRGEGSVFLQDANTMVLHFDKLFEILSYLRDKLPQVTRVTSYGRVDALAKLSVEQLTRLRQAGLDRIHAGYESGSDAVLKFINKGYTKAQEIEAGRNVVTAGIELSIYYMPGVGGKNLSDDNAIHTADVISNVNPDFVRIRTYVSKQETRLFDDIHAGLMAECTDVEKMRELRKMIENIHGAKGHLFSDHVINLFENVRGNMTTDKEEMLAVFAGFEALDERSKRRYQVARRMGIVGSLKHMHLIGSDQIEIIDRYLSQLSTDAEFEDFLLRSLRSYI